MGHQHQPPAPSRQAPTVAPQPPLRKPAPVDFIPGPANVDRALDNGDRGSCKETPDAGCTLDEHERATLVRIYSLYVTKTTEQIDSALTNISIEETIKHADELPWWASLLLSAAAAVLTDGLSVAFEVGGAAAVGALAGTGRAVAKGVSPTLGADVRKMLEVVSLEVPDGAASTIPKTIAKSAVDTARNAVKPSLGSRLGEDSEAASQKQQRLSYTDQLQSMMAERFKRLITVPPATLNDVDLRALTEQFDPTLPGNSVASYVAIFKAAIDRYMNSTVSKIGRRTAWDPKRGGKHFELETRVAWLIMKNAGKRLIYVDRAFSAWFQDARQQPQWKTPQWEISRSPLYDSGHEQLSLQDDADWHGPISGDQHRHETAEGPDKMISYVEPEFTDLALQMHEEIWLNAPETYSLDYSYVPPTLIKIRQP